MIDSFFYVYNLIILLYNHKFQERTTMAKKYIYVNGKILSFIDINSITVN